MLVAKHSFLINCITMIKKGYRNLFQISGHIFPLCISLNTNTPISATYKPVHPRASSNLQQSGWKLLLLLLLLHFQTRKL